MGITVAILIGGALIAGYTDWRTRRIPNALTAAMVVYGLVFHITRAGWSGVLLSLSGLALGLGLMLIPYLLRGLGAGDVKFLAAVGSIVGAPGVLLVFALATGLGAIMGTVALSRRRTKVGCPVSIPYGVALSFGTLLFSGGLLVL